jgi:hypothetical protein
MLNFPPVSLYSLAFCLFIFVIGGLFYYRLFGSETIKPEEECEHFKPLNNESKVGKIVAISIIILIVFSCGIWMAITLVSRTYRFRNIDINKVIGFEITKLDDEYQPKPINQKIRFDDVKTVREMLTSLSECQSVSRGKMHFKDGYRLRIIFETPENDDKFYLFMFMKNDKMESVNFLYPQITDSKDVNLGEFRCDGFRSLFLQHISKSFD